MHIELTKSNKEKLLRASYQANRSAGSLVNFILENLDLNIISSENQLSKSNLIVIMEFRCQVKERKLNIK